jgi:hypothetical protein
MLIKPSETGQLNAPRSYLCGWQPSINAATALTTAVATSTVGDMQRAQQRYRAHVFVCVLCGTTTIDMHHFFLIKIQNTNELSEPAQKTSAQATPQATSSLSDVTWRALFSFSSTMCPSWPPET